MKARIFIIVMHLFIICVITGGSGAEDQPQPQPNKIKVGEMVKVPAGESMMGKYSTEPDEGPKHVVFLDDYYIDKYEVTMDQYRKCVRAGKCSQPGTKKGCSWDESSQGNHPINCVDWNQAKAYCEYAGKRLPTEAEWEKAARGADGCEYPWGNEEPSCKYDIINENGEGCGRDSTWPVGSKPEGVSPYGVFNMSGNVSEWISDWYSETYYSKSPYKNPQGPESGTMRVIRGGSWVVESWYMAAANRSFGDPYDRYRGYGFRCAKTP